MRARFGLVKVFSTLLICGISFLLCGTIWILTTNCLFGWESTRSSMQMIFSVSSLPNLNIGQLEWGMLLAGMLGEWLRCLLPSGGIGLQNSLLYAVIDLDFLHLGSCSVWNAYVMLAAAAIEIPVFAGMAVYGYCRRQR